ncbi:unnamed protein product, partial [Mesorhabditis belari]|uniref:Store-operated calcium entry-associated regulatory factor n=1 Tax=Mesorhabditis belari TaxID=2138241 RepID=A0AAF3FJB9_9BILA
MRSSAAIPLLLAVLLRFGESAADRVLLKDVTAITLNRGQMTTGRRSSPVPQLRCVGGAAQGVYSPKTVQCYNRGSDGSDVQWECKSTMDDRYVLGRITVSCEGYDHPHDPYILKGSCGLEYELEYTSGSGSKTKSTGKQQEEGGFSPLLIVFVAIFAFIVYSFFTNRGDAQNRNDGPDGRDPPPYPGWRPGGGGDGRPPDAPPPYDDGKGTFTQGTSGSTSQSGPGFWSGAAAGAAAGYMAGRAQNSWGSSSTRQRTSAHSSSHQSAGFGGTSRR